jgi:hypothetical protein
MSKTQIPFKHYRTDLLTLSRESTAIVAASFERNGETVDKDDAWKYLTRTERAMMGHIQDAILEYMDEYEVDRSTIPTKQQ